MNHTQARGCVEGGIRLSVQGRIHVAHNQTDVPTTACAMGWELAQTRA